MHKYLQFSTDKAAFLYSLNILHIYRNWSSESQNFFFLTVNFKVYIYILNFLCSLFPLFICQ